MQKICRITNAKALPSSFMTALNNWRAEAIEIWNSDKIRWYAKLVHTDFSYEGDNYTVIPEDVYPADYFEKFPEGSICAGFEILQHTIKKDLLLLGAEKIQNFGFFD